MGRSGPRRATSRRTPVPALVVAALGSRTSLTVYGARRNGDRVDGKRVLVTGASGGIGSATARASRPRVRGGRDHHQGRERGEVVAAELPGSGVVQADLTREDEADRLFAEVRPRGVRRSRRLRGRGRSLAVGGRTRRGTPPRALAHDARRKPDGDFPDGPRVRPRARAARPWGAPSSSARPRALRRGRPPRRLRGGQGRPVGGFILSVKNEVVRVRRAPA